LHRKCGSGTVTLDISIEVDDVGAVFELTKESNYLIEYGVINEPEE
jgi:hypothetical protein